MLTITLEGPSGSGKTSFAKAIRVFAESIGVIAEVKDEISATKAEVKVWGPYDHR